jgi:hypothetical protein
MTVILAREDTADGWRALTDRGDMLEVRTDNGGPQDGTCIVAGEECELPEKAAGKIDEYLAHAQLSVMLFRDNAFAAALDEINRAIRIAPTARARFNRALIRLSAGHWPEAFDEFELRLDLMPNGKHVWSLPTPRWNSEPLAGKRLALVHDHGFGDTIMMLRYVPVLQAMGAQVTLHVPPELARLGNQLAPLGHDADFYCPAMSLLHLLRQTPDNIPRVPYLTPDHHLVAHWECGLGPKTRRRVGIAWAVGNINSGDYERSVPLEMFVDALGEEAELFSLQAQDADKAHALDVTAFEFEDFADCAALMSLMDEVVTIDTAALHLAGAIGHPRITAMLPYWSSWRWLAPWYPGVRFCQQDAPGDWASAFAKLSPPKTAAPGAGGGAYRAGTISESLARRVQSLSPRV